MKVTAIREPIQTIQEVSSKRESDQRQSQSGREQDRRERRPSAPPSSEEAKRLVDDFVKQMAEHGFATRVTGEPPVVSVLDAAGKELRQVALAELVEQSETFSPPGLTRGRLLDRKV